MTKTNIDFPFSTFAPEAEARGYKPVKYSGTAFYIKSVNGVRVDISTQGAGVVSVGYACPSAVVDLIKAEAEKAPAKVVKVLKGQVNFAFDGMAKFFELVTFVETLKVPEKKAGGRPAATETKAEKPKKEKTVSPSGSTTQDQALAAIDARNAAKASGATKSEADIEAIKAANLQRIKEAAEKAKAAQAKADAQRVEDEQIIEDMAEGDVPAFLLNDIAGKGNRQVGAE